MMTVQKSPTALLIPQHVQEEELADDLQLCPTDIRVEAWDG